MVDIIHYGFQMNNSVFTEAQTTKIGNMPVDFQHFERNKQISISTNDMMAYSVTMY